MLKRAVYSLGGILMGICVVGCAFRHEATPEERTAIGQTLATEHEAVDLTPVPDHFDRVDFSHLTAAQQAALNFQCNSIRLRSVRVGKDDAECEYGVETIDSQFAGIWPMKAVLTSENGQWHVIRDQSNQPWWWELINRTVGVK